MTNSKFDFWIQNNQNVLFTGKHGVGKTARIVEAFNRHKLKWLYFSAATLDPWVDFVGVPKEVKDEQGNAYLDLVRPKHFAEDNVEAIFLDEYNRAPQKVRNATMELLQFKSINGKKFKNLRIVWAAINPEPDGDDVDTKIEYDVEKMDPAQKDRFEVQVNVPYKPDIAYFKSKYGDMVGTAAVQWWGELTDAEKELVSPRRLDYAVNIYTKDGDLRDVLPVKINSSKLSLELKNGSFRRRMEDIFKSNDQTAAASFINDENNYNSTIKQILANRAYLEFYFNFFPPEKQMKEARGSLAVQNFLFDNFDKYARLIHTISATDQKVASRLLKFIKKLPSTPVNNSVTVRFTTAHYLSQTPGVQVLTAPDLMSMMSSYAFFLSRGTHYRIRMYDSMVHMMMNRDRVNEPLTEAELKQVANYLYRIIDSTQDYKDMSSFKNFHATFGYVHARLVKLLVANNQSVSSMFNAAPAKVNEYVNHNAVLFQ